MQGIVGKVYEVLWDGDSESMKSYITHLNKLVKEARTALPIVAALLVERVAEIEREARLDDVRKQVKGWFKTTTSLACILPILEVNAQLHDPEGRTRQLAEGLPGCYDERRLERMGLGGEKGD